MLPLVSLREVWTHPNGLGMLTILLGEDISRGTLGDSSPQNGRTLCSWVHTRTSIYVLIHDINFFLFNSNPLGPVKSIWDFDGTAVSHHYQEISLVKQKKLNLNHQPCNEDENYNFKSCVKESIARQVGCQRPWDRGNKKTKICTTRDQFRKHDMLFNKYMLYDSAQIEWTGCLKPCAYKEYRILSSVPKTISTVPEKEEVAFALWAVSQYTQHEEEVIFIELQIPFHHIFLENLGAALSFHLFASWVWRLPWTFPRILLCHSLWWAAELCRVAEEKYQFLSDQVQYLWLYCICLSVHEPQTFFLTDKQNDFTGQKLWK